MIKLQNSSSSSGAKASQGKSVVKSEFNETMESESNKGREEKDEEMDDDDDNEEEAWVVIFTAGMCDLKDPKHPISKNSPGIKNICISCCKCDPQRLILK